MALSKIDPAGLDIGQIGGRRNLIINGAMQVAQRSTSVTSYTSDGYAALDRWVVGAASFGSWTIEQSTDAPDGFSSSQKFTCTSTASLSAGSYVRFAQFIEGLNLQHLKYGASGALDLTLSFWVKSNKTGTFSSFLRNNSATRTSTTLTTISSADTWEYKTITFSGDTSGSIPNNNTSGLQVQFWFNGGSTYSGGTASDSWHTQDVTEYYGNGTLSLGGATSDYVAITGVQLEVGSVATPFEHRSYGEELALCQRYFQSFTGSSDSDQIGFMAISYTSNTIYMPVTFFQPMRSNPTVLSGGAWYARRGNTNSFTANFGFQRNGRTGCVLTQTAGNQSAAVSFWVEAYETASQLQFDAEL